MSKEFTAVQVLHGFRDMRTGGKFLLEDGTFYSVSSYTFQECADGKVDKIIFVENGMMPASNDANGNPRPDTKATAIKDVIYNSYGNRLTNLRDLKLQVEEKKVQKELDTL